MYLKITCDFVVILTRLFDYKNKNTCIVHKKGIIIVTYSTKTQFFRSKNMNVVSHKIAQEFLENSEYDYLFYLVTEEKDRPVLDKTDHYLEYALNWNQENERWFNSDDDDDPADYVRDDCYLHPYFIKDSEWMDNPSWSLGDEIAEQVVREKLSHLDENNIQNVLATVLNNAYSPLKYNTTSDYEFLSDEEIDALPWDWDNLDPLRIETARRQGFKMISLSSDRQYQYVLINDDSQPLDAIEQMMANK